MIKLMTPVECGRSRWGVSLQDKTMILGSCFADNVGTKLRDAGFDLCVNPFGTLYNPVSVANAALRLLYPAPFTEEDCVEMGAGAGRICSFSHHTSFARETPGEFLEVSNKALRDASEFFRDCNRVIISLGTAWCFRCKASGEVVSNCLKRDAKEFVRERLSLSAATAVLDSLAAKLLAAGKKLIFTVSPIRHLSDGAVGNTLSKSTLLLAVHSLVDKYGTSSQAAGARIPDDADTGGGIEYFPAYEIMTDELRDYRFYAKDLVHPSDLAIDWIWEKFLDFALPEADRQRVNENLLQARRSAHRPLLK